MNPVIEFITRRFPIDCYWRDGNCYYFALILNDRFPNSTIYYDTVNGHFVVKINAKYYDWSGIIQVNPATLVEWNRYKNVDLAHYERIKRDVLN